MTSGSIQRDGFKRPVIIISRDGLEAGEVSVIPKSKIRSSNQRHRLAPILTGTPGKVFSPGESAGREGNPPVRTGRFREPTINQEQIVLFALKL
jgi:hypothetical protein